MIIEFDEWHEDLVNPETGEILYHDALFIRASSGNVQYQAVVPLKDDEQSVKDTRAILAMAVERHSDTTRIYNR